MKIWNEDYRENWQYKIWSWSVFHLQKFARRPFFPKFWQRTTALFLLQNKIITTPQHSHNTLSTTPLLLIFHN
jgi:hypothetical protein